MLNLFLKILSQTTSLPNILPEDQIELSPNPTIDILNIISKEAFMLSYKIYDLVGKLLYTAKVNSKEVNVSLAPLSNAPYFIKLTTAKGIICKKVIKE